jgi:hypothetical protein
MQKKAEKEAKKLEEIGKLITKDTTEYKMFVKYLKFNATKGEKKMLAVDQWALCTKEQVDQIEGDKPKVIKSKYFADENDFIELAKQHKKFSDVGGVRHFHRFLDFSQSDLAKKAKIKEKTDYMTEFLESKEDSNENSKNSSSSKDSKDIKDGKDSAKSKDSKESQPQKSPKEEEITLKNDFFSKSAKFFDEEVYTIIGNLETAKINFIKGKVASLKHQMFSTEKQLEGVNNILHLALSKLGLIDPTSKSPFEKEIKGL